MTARPHFVPSPSAVIRLGTLCLLDRIWSCAAANSARWSPTSQYVTQFLLEIEIISQLSKSGALKALFQNRYKVFSDIELGSKNSHVLSRYLSVFLGSDQFHCLSVVFLASWNISWTLRFWIIMDTATLKHDKATILQLQRNVLQRNSIWYDG